MGCVYQRQQSPTNAEKQINKCASGNEQGKRNQSSEISDDHCYAQNRQDWAIFASSYHCLFCALSGNSKGLRQPLCAKLIGQDRT